MLAGIFTWLIKVASTGMLNKVTEILTGSSDAKAQVTIAAIQGETQARFAARDVLLAEQGWWVTRMIRPLFCYPLIIYYGAIVFDSIPLFGHQIGSWHIASLPAPMMEWSGWIITAYFLTRPFETISRGIMQTVGSWISKKWGAR